MLIKNLRCNENRRLERGLVGEGNSQCWIAPLVTGTLGTSREADLVPLPDPNGVAQFHRDSRCCPTLHADLHAGRPQVRTRQPRSRLDLDLVS